MKKSTTSLPLRIFSYYESCFLSFHHFHHLLGESFSFFLLISTLPEMITTQQTLFAPVRDERGGAGGAKSTMMNKKERIMQSAPSRLQQNNMKRSNPRWKAYTFHGVEGDKVPLNFLRHKQSRKQLHSQHFTHWWAWKIEMGLKTNLEDPRGIIEKWRKVFSSLFSLPKLIISPPLPSLHISDLSSSQRYTKTDANFLWIAGTPQEVTPASSMFQLTPWLILAGWRGNNGNW